MISSLWQRLSPYLHLFIRNREEWKTDRFDQHHKEMLEAMRNQDPGRMRRWLTEDLTEAAKMIHLILVQINKNKNGVG
jgi:DNA-binding GntR family transcriptional regulator